MNSRLCVGTISHTRFSPRRNAFAYRAYMLLLDLAELDVIGEGVRSFSHNGRAPVSFHDADHGPRDGSPLRPWIDGVLERGGIDLEGGRVQILAFPRVWGGRFYPVSFWYCHHADGSLRAVLAEVQNTFRDHHNYLLHDEGRPLGPAWRPEVTKEFYVSPFIEIGGVRHRFSFGNADERVGVSITDIVGGEKLLTAAVTLNTEAITDRSLKTAVLGIGPMSYRALMLIHWQAVRLAAMGVPFHARVPAPSEETTL